MLFLTFYITFSREKNTRFLRQFPIVQNFMKIKDKLTLFFKILVFYTQEINADRQTGISMILPLDVSGRINF
jgi:hypothetical protein